MRILNYILAVFTLVLVISCADTKKDIKKTSTTKKTIQHYYCANKCENSGGDNAGNCPTCNTPYTHNQAFHGSELLQNGPLKVESNLPLPSSESNNTINRPAEPAQNASGVYHYTCPKACAGGAGSAVNCISCGTLLEHNSFYHNN